MDSVKNIFQISNKNKLFVLLYVTLVPSCWSVEEYQREIFLGPRNYNHHPYEHELSNIQDPGPVTFPRNEEDVNVNNRYNIITVDGERAKHPIDNHPYSKVRQKIRYLISKKQSASRENQIDSQVYEALAEQGAKVLTYPPQDLKSYGHTTLKKKNYAFAYKVLDKGSGDDFSHQQIRNSKATNGEYRVKLPDGRVQIVSYKADKNGYNADVKYEDDPDFTHQNIIQASEIQNIHQYATHNVDVQRVPVREFSQKGRPATLNRYDYAAEEGEQQIVSPLRDPNVVILEQSGPTQIPVKYVDIGASPSPSPTEYLLKGASNHGYVTPQYPQNVQIYTSNAREHHLQGNYIPSTVATPGHDRGAVRYTSTPLPPVEPQVNHVGDTGIYSIPISSTFAPFIEHPLANYKNVIRRPDASGRVGGSHQHQTLAQENDLPEGIYIVGKTGRRK